MSRSWRAKITWSLLVGIVCFYACGGRSTPRWSLPPSETPTVDAGTVDAGGDPDVVWQYDGPLGDCDTRLYAPVLAAPTHVELCSKLTPHSNPPTSGPHYPIWATFKQYDKEVPRGFYIHSMEHGAVVFSYNCTTACPELLQRIKEFVDAQAADPLCEPPTKNRLIITPDSKLNTPFAVSAWGFSLKAQCFDSELVQQFVDRHYAKTAENFCSGQFDPTADGSGVAPNCGEE